MHVTSRKHSLSRNRIKFMCDVIASRDVWKSSFWCNWPYYQRDVIMLRNIRDISNIAYNSVRYQTRARFLIQVITLLRLEGHNIRRDIACTVKLTFKIDQGQLQICWSKAANQIVICHFLWVDSCNGCPISHRLWDIHSRNLHDLDLEL